MSEKLKGNCEFFSETGTEGGHWAFCEIQTEGYEGLHILKDGDHLTIFSPEDPSKIVWSGEISLHLYPVFTEHVFGLWIHTDQKGVNRETWAEYFIKEFPAELSLARKP